jgi:hypothetical protein
MASKVDFDAFTRAIAIYRQERHGGSEHITDKIKEDGFEVAGRFAAYFCQRKRLKLAPFEFPPCWLHDVDDVEGPPFKGKLKAARLLKRLLAAGLSQYEPDPLAALAAAEKVPAE